MDRESSDHRGRIGRGTFVAVVGPSGAGKDTVMRAAQAIVAGDQRVVFPRRLVTREPGSDENNEYISGADYAALLQSGEFALAWSAHGLGYAVPKAIDVEIAKGALVVMNISRAAIDAARQRYENCRCVYIDAPPEMRAARIGNRGRESAEDIARRMDRSVSGNAADAADLLIMNDAAPVQAAQRFVDYCLTLLGPSPESDARNLMEPIIR